MYAPRVCAAYGTRVLPLGNADPYILDNLTSEVRRGSERLDLIPVYSFNADGLWKAVQRRRGRRVGGANQLKMWRRVVDKMKAGATIMVAEVVTVLQ